MTDIDYNEVFGMTESTGEAETAEELTETGESPEGSQETAQEQEAPAEKSQTERPPSVESAPQSPRENARYASIRRKAEADAKRRAEKEVEEKLHRIGVINPQTGKPIQSRDEYEAVRHDRKIQDRHEFMQKNNMDEKQYYEFVGSLPEVRAARIAEERAVETRVQTQLSDELRQIREIDSSVGSLRDLQKNPSYGKIVDLVKRGNNLVDAYKLANFDTLTRSAAEKEKQAALNRLRGKVHMTPVSHRQGGGMSPVPDQVMNQYRIFNPGATDEEIQRHYNNEIKKGI